MHWLASALGGIGFFFAALFGAQPPAPPAPPPPPGAASTTSAGSAVVSADVENSPASAAAASSTARDASAALPVGSAWLATLPLGDGKYVTSGPKVGLVYLCHIATGGRGAEGSATWIHGASWTPAEKVAVAGSVAWPTASYAMTVAGATRTLVGNGLPTDHPSGTFPIALSDPAHRFDGNPNSIKAQSYDFSLPAYPVAAAAPGCIYGQVGIMQDGVALFDGFDAEYRDAVAHETQDAWEAHPDNSGQYHYHGFETGYVKDPVSTVVGFAFDGYPITGSLLPNGNYLHTADLDECHGLTSAVTLDGKQVTTYHYVLTQDFPYSVSCFHAASHEPKPGPAAKQGSANGARPSGPPRPS
ncbi:MAG: YHYH protein [Patescibacteria group bacterium]|nr:YHYH protein [Patescibacteria group bacterium]MDE2057650.1 YHYH protein [Patescibacteria group bacterium]